MDEEKQVEQEETQNIEQSAATVSEEKSTGAIIGAIIIVVLLIIGGLYFFGQRSNEELAPAEILSQPDAAVEVLETQGTSDEITAIEEDINVTNLDGLDVELGNIDAELSF